MGQDDKENARCAQHQEVGIMHHDHGGKGGVCKGAELATRWKNALSQRLKEQDLSCLFHAGEGTISR
jgi:hypothetical protein